MSGSGRMLAWRAHTVGGAVRLERARVPPLRAPHHVLVRVRAASLNPIDLAMLDGYGARVLNSLRVLEGSEGREGFPLVAGRDFAGSVAAAGPAARLPPAARVWGVVPPHRQGSLAEYVLVEDSWVGRAPAALDDVSAGGALYAALSACAVVRAAGLRGRGARGGGGGARGGGGRRALLLGLGGVGHAALQILVADGVQVVVGCAGPQCARAESLGAAVALDRHAPDYDRQLVELGPYDAIVDCAGLGGAAAASRAWRFSRFATLTSPLLRQTDARGLAAGTAAAATSLLAHSAGAALAALKHPAPAPGSSPGPAPAPAPRRPACLPPHVRWAFFAPNADDIEHIRRLAERGQFVVQVEEVFPWWRADEAMALARFGSGQPLDSESDRVSEPAGGAGGGAGGVSEGGAGGGARGKLVVDFSVPPPPHLPLPAH